MPVLLKDLLKGRTKPACIEQDCPIQDALKTMLKHDYSQLPIIDEHGQLAGILSEKSILRTCFDSPKSFSLALSVSQCSTRAVVMQEEDELSLALERIKGADAIVVTNNLNRPVGILTDYDTTQALRDLYEAYTMLEDIEVTIARLIETVLSTEQLRQAALFKAFGPNKRDPSKPNREFTKLDLHEKVQIITTEENWPRFEPVLKQKDFFTERMDKIGDIRNPLFHFERQPDSHEYELLRATQQWVKSLHLPSTRSAKRQSIGGNERARVSGESARKYDPLQQWLGSRAEDEFAIRVKFSDIEKLLGASLPPMAHEHPSWWANVKTSRVQSRAWLEAGWRVADVNFAAREVTFQRLNAALNQQFFADLLERLKKARPGVTQAKKTQPYSGFSFGAGHAGVAFGWAFHKDEILSVELGINSPDKQTNKQYFAKLIRDKDAIEREIGAQLQWEEMQESKLSRIRVNKKCEVTDAPEELEQAKIWALDMMLKFIDAFQPRIKNL